MRRHRARLGAEARPGVRVAEQPLVEELDGDRPAEVDVLAAKHFAHAAGRERLEDPVVADHRAQLDGRCRAGHRRAGGGGWITAVGKDRVAQAGR